MGAREVNPVKLWNAAAHGDAPAARAQLARGALADCPLPLNERYGLIRRAPEFGVDGLSIGSGVSLAMLYGSTPAMIAAYHGRSKCLELLLLSGASIHVKSQDGGSVLLRALQGRNKVCVDSVLARDPDTLSPDGAGTTPLMEAASWGASAMVAELLRRPNDVDASDRNGNTALMKACAKGSFDAAEALVKAGAEVNARNAKGESAMMVACKGSQPGLTRMLARSGADIDALDVSGQSALTRSVLKKRLGSVEALLGLGARVDAKSGKDGLSALGWAARAGWPSHIKALLAAGSPGDDVDEFGSNVYMAAIEGKNWATFEECVKAALAGGVDINGRGANGLWALKKAAGKSPSHVEVLLRAGAGTELLNEEGLTLLESLCLDQGVARDFVNKSMLELMLGAGARVTERLQALLAERSWMALHKGFTEWVGVLESAALVQHERSALSQALPEKKSFSRAKMKGL